MKKIFNLKILLILLFALVICFFASTNVEAASATINASNTVEVNKAITISVSGTGVQWNLKLIVDGSVIAQSDELENYEANKNISFSGTYTPKKEGTITVKLEGSVTEFSDGSTITNFGSKSITVTPLSTPTPTQTPTTSAPETTPTLTTTPAPAVKSSNANLANLGIEPNDFSGFTASKTEYYVTVPYEVETVNVYAKKAESSQTISGTGSKSLEAGATTRCEVTVTAENGATKTYKIFVTRKSEPTETVPNVVEEPEELLKLSSLEVKNAAITPEFNPDIYEYDVELTDDNIEKLDILATANIENASIEVTGNENFMEGENTISIVLKSEDGTKAATYTITVTKGAMVPAETSEPIIEEEQEQEQVEEKKSVFSFLSSGNTGMIVTLAIAIIVLLASIATVVVILVKNRKDSEAEMMSFTPNSEYNVFEEKNEDKIEENQTDEKPDREKRRGKHF